MQPNTTVFKTNEMNFMNLKIKQQNQWNENIFFPDMKRASVDSF